MRSFGNKRLSMLAASSLALLAASALPAVAAPTRRQVACADRRPQARRDTALAREIAEHNEAVERRKAEKMAAKLARR